MSRAPRFHLSDVPQHIIVRGNNRADLFRTDFDRTVFLRDLLRSAARHECQLHAFVLMTNHVHLLATGPQEGRISRMMQALGRRYAQYANRTHGRTGTLFEGRFKSSLVDSDRYLLTCMRYIESNPVRAAMVPDAASYVWSSHRENAGYEIFKWVIPRPEYLALGSSATARAGAYRQLFSRDIASLDLEAIRESARAGRALGGEEFMRHAEAVLGRAVRVTSRGRPIKATKNEPGPISGRRK